MIDILTNKIKTNIAQQTKLFDIHSIENVIVKTKNNVITIDGFDGEYTLSGAVDSVASKGCINDTLLFDNGQCVTQCYFGDTEVEHNNIIAHKVNIGTAFKRDVALEIIVDTKIGNSIIVYIGSARNTSTNERSSTSEDLTLKVAYTIGVLFKVDAKQIDELGCINYDALFLNSVVGAKKDGATMVEFKSVVDRFYAGESYVIDIEFGYTDAMFMDQAFIDGLKHFDSTIGELTI